MINEVRNIIAQAEVNGDYAMGTVLVGGAICYAMVAWVYGAISKPIGSEESLRHSSRNRPSQLEETSSERLHQEQREQS